MEKQYYRNKPGLLITVIAIIVLLIIILALDHFKIISLGNILSRKINIPRQNLQSGQNTGSQIIIKVGKENIYQKDLDFEIQNYPEVLKHADTGKLLLDKIIKDSVILQGAQDDRITKLDASVFNSPQKNYSQRIELITGIKKKIEMKSDSITGAIVALWFYNRGPGRVGYDKGREIARETITKLHDDVINKKLTIQQAGQEIRNDANLGLVDQGYLSNALLEFNKKPTDQVVFDTQFDQIIKNLNTGEISDVYLAKSKEWDKGRPSENMIDSVYMFAQVLGRKKSDITSFDDWVDQKSKLYAVTHF